MAVDQLKVNNILYDIGAKASNVSFNNKDTSYSANNVQDALVEAETQIADLIQSFPTAEWNKEPSLIAKKNHIYVYTDYFIYNDKSIPAIKIGDGTSYLIDMPFVDEYRADVINHVMNNTIHVTQQDKDFWNNKVSCFISLSDSEQLVFTTD